MKPEIFNSDDFYEVLYSEDFDNIELEKDREKFYEQVRKYVLCESFLQNGVDTSSLSFTKKDDDLKEKLEQKII